MHSVWGLFYLFIFNSVNLKKNVSFWYYLPFLSMQPGSAIDKGGFGNQISFPVGYGFLFSFPHFWMAGQEGLKHWLRQCCHVSSGRDGLRSRSSQLCTSEASSEAPGLMWKPGIRKKAWEALYLHWKIKQNWWDDLSCFIATILHPSVCFFFKWSCDAREILYLD